MSNKKKTHEENMQNRVAMYKGRHLKKSLSISHYKYTYMYMNIQRCTYMNIMYGFVHFYTHTHTMAFCKKHNTEVVNKPISNKKINTSYPDPVHVFLT